MQQLVRAIVSCAADSPKISCGRNEARLDVYSNWLTGWQHRSGPDRGRSRVISEARLDAVNAFVRCDVRAKPKATSIFCERRARCGLSLPSL